MLVEMARLPALGRVTRIGRCADFGRDTPLDNVRFDALYGRANLVAGPDQGGALLYVSAYRFTAATSRHDRSPHS